MALVYAFIGLLVVVLFFWITRLGLWLRGLFVYHSTKVLSDVSEFYDARPTHYRHSFVLSLTTSPTRLASGIEQSFKTLGHYDRIILNLPRLFRGTEPYDMDAVSKLQASVPRLVINWLDQDLGPQSKLLGSLDLVKDHEYIVVMDDDTLYSNRLLEAYDDAISKSHKDMTLWTTQSEDRMGVMIQPGFSTFCMKRSSLPPDFHARCDMYTKASRACMRHDDYVFGAVVQDLGFHIEKLVGFETPLQLPLGYGYDALHSEEHNTVKHVKCSKAVWGLREQCPSNRLISAAIDVSPL